MLKGNKKAKKIMLDMIINLAGTGIGLFVLQIIIYPIIGKMLDSDSYGQMQSIVSVVYLFSGTLGITLNTTRLVREYDYEESNIIADFHIYSVISFLIVLFGLPLTIALYIRGISFVDLALITVIGIFNYTSNYYAVGFRLKIDYKAIFISRILATVGYIVGFAIFYFWGKWQFVFIVAFLIETVYYYLKTDLFSEPLVKSVLFNETGKTFLNLGIANLLSRALTYFDKLLLYPLLGGTAVSIYFTANVFGKLILMTIEPITNVIMSYLAKKKTISRDLWKTAIPISLFGCAIMYFVCLIISGPIINLFYPQWAEEALKLVPLTTLCLAISAFINVIKPFTLKTLESNKQILFNATGIITYIVAVLLLYNPMGIKGCCIALLISYVINLVMIFALCFRRLNSYG